MRKIIIKTISTFFYIGYLPFIPGTFGSLVGVCLFYFLKDSIPIYILFTALLIVLGFLVTSEAERMFKKKDAKYIVIDEVSGMLLSLVSLIFIPYQVRLVIIAFIIFRILDALKPYPAGRLENLTGSKGIMSDDLIAGLYTNIILQVVLRLATLKTS